MTQEELQRLIQILGNQIESKTTTERLISGSELRKERDFGEFAKALKKKIQNLLNKDF